MYDEPRPGAKSAIAEAVRRAAGRDPLEPPTSSETLVGPDTSIWLALSREATPSNSLFLPYLPSCGSRPHRVGTHKPRRCPKRPRSTPTSALCRLRPWLERTILDYIARQTRTPNRPRRHPALLPPNNRNAAPTRYVIHRNRSISIAWPSVRVSRVPPVSRSGTSIPCPEKTPRCFCLIHLAGRGVDKCPSTHCACLVSAAVVPGHPGSPSSHESVRFQHPGPPGPRLTLILVYSQFTTRCRHSRHP